MQENGGIGQLNAALPEVVRALRDEAANNPFVNFTLTVIAFNHAADVVCDFTPIENAAIPALVAAGSTAFDAAFKKLREHMDAKMQGRNARPLFVLMSDGAPSADYSEELRKLDQHNWGKRDRTTRYAIALGENAQSSDLIAFTGSGETVLRVGFDPGALTRALVTATVTGSRTASQTAGGNPNVAAPLPPIQGVTPVVDTSGDDQVF
jgi:uncharacterized protein YegL